MERFFQLFAKFFQGLLGKLLIIANFIICLIIFDWHKFIRYLEAPSGAGCHIRSTGGGIDFSVYSSNYSVFEDFTYSIIYIFLFLFLALFLILAFPSIAMTGIILGVLKAVFPLWCVDTFDIINIPIFALVNTFYWLFLGDLIEMAHSAYLRRKPAYQKPLSVFPDSK